MAMKAMRVGERLVEMSEKIREGGDDGGRSEIDQGRREVNVQGECGRTGEVNQGARDREIKEGLQAK